MPLWLFAVSNMPLWIAFVAVPVVVARTKGNGWIQRLPRLHQGVGRSRSASSSGVAVAADPGAADLAGRSWSCIGQSVDDLSKPAQELADKANGTGGRAAVLLDRRAVRPDRRGAVLPRACSSAPSRSGGASGGRWPARAVVFGATHFQPLQFLPLVVVGAVFGYLVIRTGRLGPAIVAHMAFNIDHGGDVAVDALTDSGTVESDAVEADDRPRSSPDASRSSEPFPRARSPHRRAGSGTGRSSATTTTRRGVAEAVPQPGRGPARDRLDPGHAEPDRPVQQHHPDRRRHGLARVGSPLPDRPPAAEASACRAGRPTGTPASPRTSSTWSSRRCSWCCCTWACPGTWPSRWAACPSSWPSAAGSASASTRTGGRWWRSGCLLFNLVGAAVVQPVVQARHGDRAARRCRWRAGSSAKAADLRVPDPAARSPPPACVFIFNREPLFNNTGNIIGGNFQSTMAGEFAFSISLTLAVLYLAVAVRGLRTGRYRALAAVAVRAGRAVPPDPGVLRARLHRRAVPRPPRPQAVPVAADDGARSPACSPPFWVLPFFWRQRLRQRHGLGAAARCRQRRGQTSVSYYLFPGGLEYLFILAHLRRVGLGRSAATAWGWCSALAWVGRGGGVRLALPQARLWNARLLPFMYLSVSLLAAIGVGEFLRIVGRRHRATSDSRCASSPSAAPFCRRRRAPLRRPADPGPVPRTRSSGSP